MKISFINVYKLLIIFVLIRSNISSSISCNTINPCNDGRHIYCDPNSDCTVQCNGDSVCESVVIYCPSGAHDCKINCNGEASCRYATVNASEAIGGDLIVTANGGEGAYQLTNTICPTKGNCYVKGYESHSIYQSLIDATNSQGGLALYLYNPGFPYDWSFMAQKTIIRCPSGSCYINCGIGFQNCNQMQIISQPTTTSLTINAQGGYVLSFAHIWCPPKSSTTTCIIDIDRSRWPWPEPIANMNIYAMESLENVVLDCNKRVEGDCLNINNLPIIHCMKDYSSSCEFMQLTDYSWRCLDTSSLCNNWKSFYPTTHPSEYPTIASNNPTMSPTLCPQNTSITINMTVSHRLNNAQAEAVGNTLEIIAFNITKNMNSGYGCFIANCSYHMHQYEYSDNNNDNMYTYVSFTFAACSNVDRNYVNHELNQHVNKDFENVIKAIASGVATGAGIGIGLGLADLLADLIAEGGISSEASNAEDDPDPDPTPKPTLSPTTDRPTQTPTKYPSLEPSMSPSTAPTFNCTKGHKTDHYCPVSSKTQRRLQTAIGPCCAWKIMSWNAKSLAAGGKWTTLKNYILANNIDVILIQESGSPISVAEWNWKQTIKRSTNDASYGVSTYGEITISNGIKLDNYYVHHYQNYHITNPADRLNSAYEQQTMCIIKSSLSNPFSIAAFRKPIGAFSGQNPLIGCANGIAPNVISIDGVTPTNFYSIHAPATGSHQARAGWSNGMISRMNADSWFIAGDFNCKPDELESNIGYDYIITPKLLTSGVSTSFPNTGTPAQYDYGITNVVPGTVTTIALNPPPAGFTSDHIPVLFYIHIPVPSPPAAHAADNDEEKLDKVKYDIMQDNESSAKKSNWNQNATIGSIAGVIGLLIIVGAGYFLFKRNDKLSNINVTSSESSAIEMTSILQDDENSNEDLLHENSDDDVNL
eukprot:242844_1